MRHSSHRIATLVLVAYLSIVVLLAFMRWTHGASCPWYLSLLFFMPVGILLTLTLGRRRWLVAMAFGILAAAWIEAAQAAWMPEGYGRVEDTLWGATGVVAGSLAVLLVDRVIHSRTMRSHVSFRIVTEAGRREIPQD